ncbi:MAG: glycerate kinase type-2 family protein, partial [Bacillota bacterium]
RFMTSIESGTSFDPRSLLLSLFKQGLDAVNGRATVRAWLEIHSLHTPFHLVALGKAAEAMAAGALEAAGSELAAGLVVTRRGYLETPVQRDPRLVTLEAGHPLPDEQSLAAGRALELFLDSAPADASFLFLVSGGTSSLVEAPVAGVSLRDLQQLNLWLLGSGLPISDINRVRAALSRIKGGRLAEHLKGRKATLLLMSDVPGDVMSDIGSGLLLPGEAKPIPGFPPGFASLPFQTDTAQPCENVEAYIVASNRLAREAVAKQARDRGFGAVMHADLPSGDAASCGEAIARDLLQAPGGVIHIWGGETTVRLPEQPGQGGRNQHLALAAARVLAGHGDVFLLSAGTDGSDGNSDDAGALVDSGTVERGDVAGYDALDCLERADAGTFLEASGDLVCTGPTGTNVMDLMIGLKK